MELASPPFFGSLSNYVGAEAQAESKPEDFTHFK